MPDPDNRPDQPADEPAGPAAPAPRGRRSGSSRSNGTRPPRTPSTQSTSASKPKPSTPKSPPIGLPAPRVIEPGLPSPIGKRLVAGLCDLLLGGFLLVIPAMAGMNHVTTIDGERGRAPTTAGVIAGLLLVAAYQVVGIAAFGKTLAKAALGLEVKGADGKRASWFDALLRHSVTQLGLIAAWIAPDDWTDVTGWLPTIWFVLIYVPIIQDPARRGLHDRLARTVVVTASQPRLDQLLHRGVQRFGRPA